MLHPDSNPPTPPPTQQHRHPFRQPRLLPGGPNLRNLDPSAEKEIDESQVGVGSIAAGGRYDALVGAFLVGAAGVEPCSKEGKKAMAGGTPCVGVSIGMDRIFALVWPKWVEKGGRTKGTMAYVMSPGDGLLEERIKLVKELGEGGIKAKHFSIDCLNNLTLSDLCFCRPISLRKRNQTPSPICSGRERRSTFRYSHWCG